jgi:predicted metalloendopeptidase
VIGHEIGHAYYNQFSPLEGLNVNGQLTLGENIGDLTGLVLGYRAYRRSLGGEEAPVSDGLTRDQRFFMGWAQVWRSKMSDELSVFRSLFSSAPSWSLRCSHGCSSAVDSPAIQYSRPLSGRVPAQ